MQPVETLYKYRVASDRTEDIFVKHAVWLATPESLNDPQDCRAPDLTREDLAAYEQQVRQYQLSGFVMDAASTRRNGEPFFNLDEREVRVLLGRVKRARLFDDKYRVAVNFLRKIGAIPFTDARETIATIKTQIAELGVLSLSTDPLSTLMWSHYADSHRGLALGFSVVPGSKLSNTDCCRAVSYDNAPQKLDVRKGLQNRMEMYRDDSGMLRNRGAISLDDAQVRRTVFTKTAPWAYEQEWRYVNSRSGQHEWPAPLTRLIFGVNCPVKTRAKYVALCEKHLTQRPEFWETYYPSNSNQLALRIARK